MEKPSLREDLKDFICCLLTYGKHKGSHCLSLLEKSKSHAAAKLYWQRGRYARPFMHSGMAILVLSGLTLGPVLVSETFPGTVQDLSGETMAPISILSVSAEGVETATLVSEKPRAEVLEYEVQEGDTVSAIAEKFVVSIDTIRWENDLESIKAIKPGQTLKVLPVTGIAHQVKHGETVYSVAKKYSVDAQVIVNWPYNSFANDETFALAAGQTLIVPEGVMPKVQPWSPPQKATFYQVPLAGAVTGSGQFAWPCTGRFTQGYTWYHKAIDIANNPSPILAADAGTVTISGWPYSGYGNLVVIDHANGFQTWYAHLSKLDVTAGARVAKGQVLGTMGSTGRSTGTHLHFEIRKNGAAQNPMDYLK